MKTHGVINPQLLGYIKAKEVHALCLAMVKPADISPDPTCSKCRRIKEIIQDDSENNGFGNGEG